MEFKPFSKRSRPVPDVLSYEIPEFVRARIAHTLGAMLVRFESHIEGMFVDAARMAKMQHGGLRGYRGERLAESAESHFRSCTNDECIDFLEWAFLSESSRFQQPLVDAVNEIFREEGIGYEFSPYTTKTTELGNARSRFEVLQVPQATKKSNDVIHSTTTMPALQLLSGQIWQAANEEMLKAHKHLRDSNYKEAISLACCAVESVLKIICEQKNWPYKPDKDTLNVLLQTCHKHGLFPSPYIQIFQQSSGEIRNKWGGHGKGPLPVHGESTFEMAEHMIQITSAHILLLARWAGPCRQR